MGRLLIQFPGSSTATVSSETLPKNVIVVDEDLHQLRIHDGVTAGGYVVSGGGGGGSLPSQTGHAGEFLKTDGTDASWAAPVVATFRVWEANE